MEILTSDSSLRSFLALQGDKHIHVVSAFAYSTAALVSEMKRRGNTVEVMVGTINSFTDPDFIDEVAQVLPRGFWIDFRGHRSIHWKLYLISPDTWPSRDSRTSASIPSRSRPRTG